MTRDLLVKSVIPPLKPTECSGCRRACKVGVPKISAGKRKAARRVVIYRRLALIDGTGPPEARNFERASRNALFIRSAPRDEDDRPNVNFGVARLCIRVIRSP